MKQFAKQPTSDADCPINLLRGYHHTRARRADGDLIRIALVTILIAVFLAGPAALLALSGRSQPQKTLASAQAELCKKSIATCGDMTGSVTFN